MSFLEEVGEVVLRQIAYNKGRKAGEEGNGRNMLYQSSMKQEFQQDAFEQGYQDGLRERGIKIRK